MAITKKKPPVKVTAGAQYICFNTMNADNEWTEDFETTVLQLPTVVNVAVTDNTDAYAAARPFSWYRAQGTSRNIYPIRR